MLTDGSTMRALCLTVAWTLCGLLFSSDPAGAQMVASNDRVRVECRLSTDTDEKDLKGTTEDTVTQKKSITVQLSGKARSPETRVVKWTAYGRNLKTNDLTVLDSGKVKLDLDRSGAQTITTKTVSSTYTDDHAVVSKRGGRGKGGGGGGGGGRQKMPKAKKVEASGTKFAGYSVQVLDGAQVVGETSDPAGISVKR
jgi:hypothetical protein